MPTSDFEAREKMIFDRILEIVLRDVPEKGKGVAEFTPGQEHFDYANGVLRDIATEIEAFRSSLALGDTNPAPVKLPAGSPIAKMEATLKDWRWYHEEEGAPEKDHKIAIAIHRDGISIDIETLPGEVSPPRVDDEPSGVSLMLEIDSGRPKIVFGKNGADPHGILLVGDEYAAVSPSTGTEVWQVLMRDQMARCCLTSATPTIPHVIQVADEAFRLWNPPRMKP